MAQTDKIRGIAIQLEADTSGLVKSFGEINTTVKNTQKELKDVEKLLKLDPKNTELLRQKQQLLAKQVEQTSKELETLNKMQDEMDAQGVDKNSEQYMALQRQIVDTEISLEKLQKATDEFGSVGAQQVAAVGKQMEAVGGKIEAAGQKISKISAAAAGAEAALIGIGVKAITTADDLNTMAAQTGMSTAEIQKFQYASDRIDVSLDTVTGALSKLKKGMSGNTDAFKKLGVDVTYANGQMRDVNDVFYEVIEALSYIGNETERDQLAMQIFGKSADQLAGIIDDGGAALRQYGQEAEQLGLIVSDEVLGSLNKTNDEIDKAKAQLSAAMLQLGAVVAQVIAPIITKISNFVEKVVQWMQQLTPAQAKIVMVILAVVAAIGPLLIVIGKVVSSIGHILTYAPMIVSAIGTIGTALTTLFSFIAANPFTLVIAAAVAAVIAAVVLIVKNIDIIKQALAQFREWVHNLFVSIGQGIMNVVNSIANGIRNTINMIFGWLKSLLSFGSSVASSFGGTQYRVGRMAAGGTISAGASLVGENGPELLTMVGTKAQITPLTNGQAQTALSQIGAGGGETKVSVNFTGSLSQLARILQPEIQVETARRGVSLVKA